MPGKDTALAEQEVRRRLAALPGWEYRDAALRRTYQTDGWRGSMLVTNAIAFICEAADHHADLAVSWPSVGVALSTPRRRGAARRGPGGGAGEGRRGPRGGGGGGGRRGGGEGLGGGRREGG